jgi:hypothetical protein
MGAGSSRVTQKTRNPYRLVDIAQGVVHNRAAVALAEQQAYSRACLARAQQILHGQPNLP